MKSELVPRKRNSLELLETVYKSSSKAEDTFSWIKKMKTMYSNKTSIFSGTAIIRNRRNCWCQATNN